MAITSQARLAALLALAIAGQGLAGCGKKAKHGGDAAHPGSTTVPVITPESLTFTDPDSWSSDTIKTAKVPGATAMALGPYGNCAEYETAFMDHAKLVQAMYLRRFLAWARYNLKEGSFANIPLIPGFNSGASASSAPGAPSAAASDKSMASAPDSTAAESAGKTDGGGNAGAGPTNASDTSAPAASGPKGFETNNQEAAATRVDETDYVKSDGRFTFVAHGDVLRVSDLTGKLLDTLLLINETPRGLHLANGRLVLVTEARNAFFNTSSIGTMAVNDPEYWRHYYEFARHLVWQASQYVQVREFSVGGDGKLTLARQRTVGGYFRDGREVNGIVHVVTQQQLPWSVLATGLALDLHPAYSGFKTDEDIGKYAAAVASDNLIFMHRLMFEQANELTGDHQRTFAAGECKRFNRITTQVPHELDGAVIRDALAQWDTKLAWTLGSVIVPQWFVDYPILPEFNHLIQITSVDLSGGKDDARAFSFGPQFPSIVYGSADKLVTGGANANWEGFFERLKLLSDAETHGVVRITPAPLKNSVASRFDFVVFGLAADGASPAGFGSVPGIPRDQYALDFDADTLRIVVTETTGTEPNQISQILNGNQATPATTSQVALHVVTPAAAGSSEWKAVGRVALPNYSFVRFSESRAVLATGDQIQAVDLRDAAAPRLAGTLALGVNVEYLHPTGDGTLIAMGGTMASFKQPESCPSSVPGQARNLVLVTVDASNVDALSKGVTATIDATPTLTTYGCLTRPSFGSTAERSVKSFRYDSASGLVTIPMDTGHAPRTDILSLTPGTGFGYFASFSSPQEWSSGRSYRYSYSYDAYDSYYSHGYYRPYWSYPNNGRRFLIVDDLLIKVNGYFDEGLHLDRAGRGGQVKMAKDLVLTYKAVDAQLSDWRPEGEDILDHAWTANLISQ